MIKKLTDSEYFSLAQVSNSDLSLIKQSYSHYLEKDRKIVSDAMHFGRAFDQYILRPDVFHQEFIVAPDDMDRRTKIGKETYQNLLDSGRHVLSSREWLDLNIMRDNLKSHPIAKNIIENSENEGVFTGVLEGVDCRCKIDIFNQGYLFDIKTCQLATANGFKKDIGQRAYHRQLAFYIDLMRQNTEGVKGGGLMAIEKPSPSSHMPKNSGVGVYWIGEQSIEEGRHEYKKLLGKYKKHKENPSIYTGYSDVIETLEVPLWATQVDL